MFTFTAHMYSFTALVGDMFHIPLALQQAELIIFSWTKPKILKDKIDRYICYN